jgi:magnesium-transporting ATPase (P-type)
VADGLVLESYGLVVDEASLTGESDPIKKNESDPWCRSGTQVRAVLRVTVCAGVAPSASSQASRPAAQQ